MIEQGRRWIVLALCALAFFLRAAGLGFQSLWRDEVDAIRFASRPLDELLRTFVTAGENGPLFYLLLRPWLDLAGQREFALRYLSVLFGVLAVPLVYRLARRLFPSLPGVALVAALLTATSPYLIWYSQEGKMYTLGLLLVLLSMDRFLAAMEQGGWQRWLVYVVATSLAFYVHLLAVLIVPVQVAAFFLADKRSRSVRWKPWLVSLAVLTLPYLPLLLWQLPLLLEPAETGYQFVPLHQMLLSLLANYSLGVAHGASPWIAALFLTVLLAAGLHRAPDRPWRSSVGVLLCWLVLPVASFFLVTLVRPLYTARYLIFVLPSYLLLLAVGVVSVGRRTRLVAGLLLGTILVTSGWGAWRQASTPIKADFRTATRYVAQHSAPLDLILFQLPYGRYSFDYYYQQQPIGRQPKQEVASAGQGRHRVFLPLMAAGTGASYRWAEGLYTNDGMDPHEVDRRMSEVSEGSHVVWLVATETSMWDGRGLVQGWLNDHATLTDEAQFVRVAVYRYELP